YMAADNEPSLVQHYWSLSIEEQFYVMLPLLLLGACLVTKFLRRTVHDPRTNAQKVFIWTLLAITVATFIFSVLYTNYSAHLRDSHSLLGIFNRWAISHVACRL